MKNSKIILFTVLILGVLLAGCATTEPVKEQSLIDTIDNGVVRSFEKMTVAPGETFKVTLDIKLKPTETYYAFEENVPMEFSIINKENVKNVIREVEFQNAVSNTYTYTIMAPEVPGTYTFTGEYSIESSEVEISQILGDKVITVE